VERLDATSRTVLRFILAGQPLTEAKVAFAWQIAAGPALARAATVSWSPTGTLVLHADSSAWRLELLRAKGVLAERMGQLLGREAVRRIQILERP